MSTYKIIFYYNKNKTKHKLYDTEKSYKTYLKYHIQWLEDYYKGYPVGLIGLIDGKPSKTYGLVP